jgi:cellular nucleic acid-binding protein
MSSPFVVYVLACEQGKYYVGKTSRSLANRVIDHFKDAGSWWTRQYPPIRVIQSTQSTDPMEEDRITKVFMQEYGIQNVRGGSYTSIELPEYQLMALTKEFSSCANLCFRCNRPGHFVSKCYARTTASGDPIVSNGKRTAREFESIGDNDFDSDEFSSSYSGDASEKSYQKPKFKRTSYLSESKGKCYRCGRWGHYSNQCFAGTHVNGNPL